MGKSGSIRGFAFDGIPYNVKGDADVALGDTVEREGLAHSGGTTIKETLVPATGEGINLDVSLTEWGILKDSAADGAIKTISLSYADGSSAKTQGMLTVGKHQSAENGCEVVAIPTSIKGWEIFGA